MYEFICASWDTESDDNNVIASMQIASTPSQAFRQHIEHVVGTFVGDNTREAEASCREVWQDRIVEIDDKRAANRLLYNNDDSWAHIIAQGGYGVVTAEDVAMNDINDGGPDDEHQFDTSA